MQSSYMTIRHSNGLFRASPSHIVFVIESNARLEKNVAELRVGDQVIARVDSGVKASKVLSIQHTQGQLGVYAPLTSSGKIVVDNVIASNYAVPSLSVNLPHSIAHVVVFPIRAYHKAGVAPVLRTIWEFVAGVNAEDTEVMHPFVTLIYKRWRLDKFMVRVMS